MDKPVLKVENLNVTFETKYGHAVAVNDISFDLKKGEKLGLVGNSQEYYKAAVIASGKN